jgi:pyrroline-5-carboxylate reductase
MITGFIGTGVITEAILTGLAKAGSLPDQVLVSSRSTEVSERLARAHPCVRICDDNQQIVDAAELVVLAIRPQIAEGVLRGLSFKPGQHVCSLVASLSLERLRDWIGSVSAFRAIPLPPVADLRGVTAIYPDDPVGAALFRPLGTVVAAHTIDEFNAYACASALMGTYFGILATASDWLEAHGVPRHDAQSYLAALFYGLGATSLEQCETAFEVLREGHSTPGGLNAQAFETFRAANGTKALDLALDTVADRLRRTRTD